MHRGAHARASFVSPLLSDLVYLAPDDRGSLIPLGRLEHRRNPIAAGFPIARTKLRRQAVPDVGQIVVWIIAASEHRAELHHRAGLASVRGLFVPFSRLGRVALDTLSFRI